MQSDAFSGVQSQFIDNVFYHYCNNVFFVVGTVDTDLPVNFGRYYYRAVQQHYHLADGLCTKGLAGGRNKTENSHLIVKNNSIKLPAVGFPLLTLQLTICQTW